MTTTPFISIVIPISGRLQYVTEALNSVYQQVKIDRSDIEIFIVEDDHPKDTIRTEIKKLYPDVNIIINHNEHSPAGSRNAALSLVKGKYLVFLDSDDKLKPKFLSEMLATLEKDKLCSGTVCLSNTVFDGPYKLTRKIKLVFLMLIRDVSMFISYIINHKYLFPSAFYLCQISHMMFKADKIKGLKFNYTYSRGGEDWDFFNQCLKRGPIRIFPQRLLTFRYSQISSTNLSINLQLKWQSYKLLASELPPERKRGLHYKLFLYYIQLFKGKNA